MNRKHWVALLMGLGLIILIVAGIHIRQQFQIAKVEEQPQVEKEITPPSNPSSAQPSNQVKKLDAQWKTYRNAGYGVEFQVPKNWDVSTANNDICAGPSEECKLLISMTIADGEKSPNIFRNAPDRGEILQVMANGIVYNLSLGEELKAVKRDGYYAFQLTSERGDAILDRIAETFKTIPVINTYPPRSGDPIYCISSFIECQGEFISEGNYQGAKGTLQGRSNCSPQDTFYLESGIRVYDNRDKLVLTLVLDYWGVYTWVLQPGSYTISYANLYNNSAQPLTTSVNIGAGRTTIHDFKVANCNP